MPDSNQPAHDASPAGVSQPVPCRLKKAASTALRRVATACKSLWSLIWTYPKTSAAIGLFIFTFLRRDVLIQPLTFPTAITYDGHVAAKRLAYHMKQLQEQTDMDRERSSIYIDPLFLQLPSFSIGGLTVDPFTLLTMLQHYLQLSTSFIAGEVTQGDKGMLLTLQGSFGGSVHSIEVPARLGTDVDTLLEQAAQKFLSEVHPLLMATYWSQTGRDSAAAVALIRRALADHDRNPQPASTITSIRRFFGAKDTNPDIGAYLLWGWILTREGQFDSAIDKFEQAEILSQGKAAQVYDHWGWALFQKGDPAAAEEKFRKALEIDPSNPYSNNHLGLVLWRQNKDLESAEYCCEQAIKVQPTYAEAYEVAATIMCDRQVDLDRAVRYARRSIDLKPDHCSAYSTLARALIARDGAGGPEADAVARGNAIAALRLGIGTKECATVSSLRNDLAEQYLQTKRFADATSAAADAAWRLDGGAQSFDLLGRALQQRGLLPLAVEAFEQGLDDTKHRDPRLTYILLDHLCTGLNRLDEQGLALQACSVAYVTLASNHDAATSASDDAGVDVARPIPTASSAFSQDLDRPAETLHACRPLGAPPPQQRARRTSHRRLERS